MVFAYFFGMCSYLAVSKTVKTAVGLGAAVIFVLTITVPVNYLLDTYILRDGALVWLGPEYANIDLSFLSFIMFIAVIASMVIIPLQTVIPEELAFRGVLHGAMDRAWGFRGVAAAGSMLFGLWHVSTSLGLTSNNVGFTRIFGGGFAGMVAGVLLAVMATAAAGLVFTWLRRRSGSLIAPIALHWSLNGLGALAAAMVWHLTA